MQLAAQHGADLRWRDRLPRGSVALAYSFQLEDALRPGTRPVVFRAHLRDITRVDDQFYLIFLDPKSSRLTLKLAANPSQIEKTLHGDQLSFEEYAIVTTVDSVHRPLYQITAESTNESRSEDISFVIEGKCIDLVLLPY